MKDRLDKCLKDVACCDVYVGLLAEHCADDGCGDEQAASSVDEGQPGTLYATKLSTRSKRKRRDRQ